MDQDDLSGAEPALLDDEGPHRIVGDNTAALRMTWASPSDSPRRPYGLRRASMHASTATWLAGGMGSLPLSNAEAYASVVEQSVSDGHLKHLPLGQP